MPTLNPRITITLQPATAAQLRELSRLTGNSQSAVVSELLETSSPVFDRLIRVLSAAEKAKQSLSAQVSEDLTRAQERIEQQLGLALEHFEEGTSRLLREAEAVRRRGRRGAPLAGGDSATGGGSTPLSNRGVRSHPKARSRGAKS